MVIRQYRRPVVFRPQRFSRSQSNLLHEFNQLQGEMDRLFGNFFSVSRPGFPAMNVVSQDDQVVLTAAVPGVAPDDIEITVTGQTVTISGERKLPELSEDSKWLRRERAYGKFTRSLDLPFTIDADRVAANFDNGMLYLMLPQVEAEKPKKIAIQTA